MANVKNLKYAGSDVAAFLGLALLNVNFRTWMHRFLYNAFFGFV